MREYVSSDGIKVRYPDAISFAFNPEFIIVDKPMSLGVTISGRGKSFTDTRHEGLKDTRINMSYYLQQLFDVINEPMSDNIGRSNTGIDVSVRLFAMSESIAPYIVELSFSTFVIWGGIAPGETFNPSREIQWFKNMPFTFSMYSSAIYDIFARIDGGASTKIGNTTQGLSNYEVLQNANREIVLSIGGQGEVVNVFDYTFDYTFRLSPSVNPVNTIKLVVNDCTDGVYLKWIDKHGFYQYYLFNQRGVNYTTSANGDAINMNFDAFGRWHNGVSRQNKSEQQTINVYASFIEASTYFMILSLLASPVVTMLVEFDDKQEWIPVKIVPQSRTMSGLSLQDIELSVILPQSPIQTL